MCSVWCAFVGTNTFKKTIYKHNTKHRTHNSAHHTDIAVPNIGWKIYIKLVRRWVNLGSSRKEKNEVRW
jgi:hypothetical protein